jgi:hypothetical protein
LPSTRRAVADTGLAEINQAAATTGNDPALDTLLLRLHTETACRRGGALALRPHELDPTQCLIFLREKGETVRWQPISPTLMTALTQHAHDRHAPTDGQLLRYHHGRPITRRRYDHLWSWLGTHHRYRWYGGERDTARIRVEPRAQSGGPHLAAQHRYSVVPAAERVARIDGLVLSQA